MLLKGFLSIVVCTINNTHVSLTKVTMNLSLAFFIFYLAFHSVNGYEATSLRGRSLQETQASVDASGVGANNIKNRFLREEKQDDSHIIGSHTLYIYAVYADVAVP